MSYISKSKQAEIEAGRLEGLEPMTPEMKKLHKEYNSINDKIAVLNARKTEIQTEVSVALDMAGMKMFIVDGLNTFGFSDVNSTTVNRKELESKFPEVAALVISSKSSTRFYSRK